MASTVTRYRTCPLCEAMCGLELTVTDGVVTRVRGDREHVFSRGYLCPKGASFGQLVADPDRLRRPLVRSGGRGSRAAAGSGTGTGTGFTEVGWDEAFARVDAGLRRVIDEHGPDAVAVYLGNPNVHTMAGGLAVRPFLKALRSRNLYTASTVDQIPKMAACAHLYGHPSLIPVPDLERTDYLLMLGANPAVSNGSLASAANFPALLRAISARGGRVVVVDPRRTRTAELADEHLFIRPGTDAFLLFAVVHTLFADGLVRLGRLADHVTGVAEVERLARDFTPELAEGVTRVPAEVIRRLARELAAAPTAAVYGRMGTTTVPFGTLTSWLIDVVNVLTGNLDSPGGVMFPLAPHARRDTGPGGRGFVFGRWATRVRGLGEVMGELPVAALAEEIDTPGEGRLRALVTIAGNPVLSTPNSARLAAALDSLDFMVSVDPYLNETTRHADVILPPTEATRVGHYDFSLLGLAVRNFAAYSPPVLPPDPGGMDEFDILARLAGIAAGQGPETDLAAFGEVMVDTAVRQAVADPASTVHGRDADELRAMVTGDTTAERLLDVALRSGVYGDGFGARPDGLSLAALRAAPHGVDLGPLRPRLPGLLRTRSGRVELCPEALAADVPRLLAARAELAASAERLVLIGRRHLRSNNSWMHNIPALVKGRDRCTLLVHPDDAARLGLAAGGVAAVTSAVGTVAVTVEVSDEIMPGTVSLPHGWGHGEPGTGLRVAAAHPGVNSNLLTDERAVDPLSGTAVLNGIPVEVKPVS